MNRCVNVQSAPPSAASLRSVARRTRGAVVLPGVILAGAAAAAGLVAGRLTPLLSATLVSLIVGVFIANVLDADGTTATGGGPGAAKTVRQTALRRLEPGSAFTAQRLLRAGIVLLGLNLSLASLVQLGWQVLALAGAVVVIGVASGLSVGRLLGLPSSQAALIACGFSICGAAAIAGARSVVDSDDQEITASIALVVVFGTLMIPLVALVGPTVAGERFTAIWAGASVHEVAQVVAVGSLVSSGVLSGAVAVKLARVLLLAPVVITLGAIERRRPSSQGTVTSQPSLVPTFVIGFVGAVAIRSLVPVPEAILHIAQLAQSVLIAMAMFALGCGVRWVKLRQLRGAVLVLAAACTAVVTVLGFVGAWVIVHL